jgi:subtilisin family serine protease
VIPVRVGDNFARWFSQVARAFVYVANLKATGELGDAPLVISMSMGGFRDDAVMAAAIDYAIASGVIVVVAAGNEANAGMRFPARYPPVISAAATGWVDQFPPDDPTLLEFCVRDVGEGDVSRHLIAPFSAWELPGQDLDVAAPGLPVPVACTRDGRVDYTFFVGTSAACPHVSGVAALMLQKNPNLTQPQVEAILEGSAMPLPPGCRSYVLPAVGPGNPQPTWSDHRNVSVFGFASCWGANAASHGLLQADAALTATPLP